jgi:hypothetical protein
MCVREICISFARKHMLCKIYLLQISELDCRRSSLPLLLSSYISSKLLRLSLLSQLHISEESFRIIRLCRLLRAVFKGLSSKWVPRWYVLLLLGPVCFRWRYIEINIYISFNKSTKPLPLIPQSNNPKLYTSFSSRLPKGSPQTTTQ